jgi:NAD(P)-dependent dehydrogenase (short-subunit alcohol dehydrogenase family)
MDLGLTGKRALVTGSTAGIGEAIARVLAREGAAVALHGRDQGRGAALVEELKRQGSQAVFLSADMTVADDVSRLADDVRQALGGVDILINNAALYPQHTWFGSPAQDWSRLYEVNVVAGVRLIQMLVPEMKNAGWGRVVMVSSGEGSRPFAHMPGYGATKAAVNNMTSSLCLAVAGSGVTVNAVSAGLIRTAEVERWFYAEAKTRGWGDDWEQIEANILKSYLPVPVGHIGKPQDVARVVAFLVSPYAGYINGAVLRVDGGSHTWAG